MKINGELLKENGYSMYTAGLRIDNPAYVHSWQKAFYINEDKYYVNIDEFDFAKVPGYPYNEAFGSHAQFHTVKDETFNIEYFVEKNTELIDIEMFFQKIYERMDCKSE